MSATLSLFDRPTTLRERPLAPVAAERSDGNKPRDYQSRCISAVLVAFEVQRSTLAVLATGLGKTVIAAELARLRGDVLFIAHRETLIDQAAQKLRRWTGAHVAVEKAERRSRGGKFVVASIQSLKGDRLRYFAASHQHIATIIIDECFPGGTLVDGTPIEDIRVGDLVTSVDHSTGEIGARRVLRTFRKESTSLVRVSIGDARITSTANHPFFVKGRGYVEAKDLNPGDLLCVRRGLHSRAGVVSEAGEGVFGRVQSEDLRGDFGAHEHPARASEDAREQPHAPGGQPRTDAGHAAQDRTSAEGAGREWTRANGPGADAFAGVRMVDAGRGEGGSWQGKRLADLLQAGRCGPVDQGSDRGGRRQSLRDGAQGAGREEGCFLAWARVDGVARVEPGSPGGTPVYNLEVEGAHTYFAAGVLVHNCHRAIAKSYRDVLAAFPNAKVLGLTATADRGDKRALATVFEKFERPGVPPEQDHGAAFKYDIAQATADGWLTVGDWYPLSVDGISLDDIGLKGNDIDQGALDEALVLQVAQIARAMHGAANGEMSLAFTPGVKVAEAAAEALNRLEPGCARATWGEQDFAVRKAIEDAWVRGDFPYLLNCALYIEGADFPKLRNVFMFAATKSRLRWAQIYGRGTRLWPHGIDHLQTVEERLAAIAASPKPRWKFFDAQYGKHGHTLAGPVDLLGGRYDDETKERAKKNLAERGGNVGEALELAKAELEEERRKKLARLAAKAAKAKGTVLVGAARAACELFGVSTEASDEPRPEDYVEAATAQYLEDKGVKGAAKMPWAAARELERTLRQRAARGLCSYKQQKSLTFRGVANAVALTSTQASRLMSVVAPYNERHDWGWRFAPGQPEEILGLRQPGEEG